MNTYKCDNHRPVLAETARDAAEIFAGLKARDIYGRNARVGALCCYDSSPDNTSHNWEAFVGYSTGPHETTGRNIWFQVYVA